MYPIQSWENKRNNLNPECKIFAPPSLEGGAIPLTTPVPPKGHANPSYQAQYWCYGWRNLPLFYRRRWFQQSKEPEEPSPKIAPIAKIEEDFEHHKFDTREVARGAGMTSTSSAPTGAMMECLSVEALEQGGRALTVTKGPLIEGPGCGHFATTFFEGASNGAALFLTTSFRYSDETFMLASWAKNLAKTWR